MTTRLYLSIEPNRLSAVLIDHSRWKGHLTQIGQALVLEGPPDSTLNAAALDAYQARAQSLIVTLSNSLCLYGVFARPQGVRNPQELDQYAKMRMLERFGESLQTYRVHISTQSFTTHDVACAVSTSLLQNIERLATHLKLPLDSVQPYGMRELRHQKLPAALTWFITLEQHSCTLFAWQHNTLMEIRTFQNSDQGWTYPSLQRQISRDAIRLGLAQAATGYICGSMYLQERTLPMAIQADATEFGGHPVAWQKNFRLALSPVWQKGPIR